MVIPVTCFLCSLMDSNPFVLFLSFTDSLFCRALLRRPLCRCLWFSAIRRRYKVEIHRQQRLVIGNGDIGSCRVAPPLPTVFCPYLCFCSGYRKWARFRFSDPTVRERSQRFFGFEIEKWQKMPDCKASRFDWRCEGDCLSDRKKQDTFSTCRFFNWSCLERKA